MTPLVGALSFGRVPALVQPAQHEDHATPAGWKLSWPTGDLARGRAAFVKFECGSCHDVRGKGFRAPRQRATLGPELSAMGPLHEVEYYVEAIVNPGAVVEPGQGYEALDRSSKMPSYNDLLTVQELIDLVAYLKALRRPAPGSARTRSGATGGQGSHH